MIVLWIALWIIVALITIPVMLAIILLHMPLRYRVQAHISKNPDIKVSASFFLRLIRVVFEHRDGQTTFQCRIAWKLIGQPKKSTKKSPTPTPTPTPPPSPPPPKEYKEPSPASSKKAKAEKKQQKKAITLPPESSKEKKSSPKILDQINAVLTYPDRKIIMRLAMRFVKKIFRALRPKHFSLKGVLGFNDPATTGIIMGLYAALKSALKWGNTAQLFGDFSINNPQTSVDIAMRGSVSAARLLRPVIWLLLKKPIRKLIKAIRAKG